MQLSICGFDRISFRGTSKISGGNMREAQIDAGAPPSLDTHRTSELILAAGGHASGDSSYIVLTNSESFWG